MAVPSLVVPVVMIVAGLAVCALLLRFTDVRKRRDVEPRFDDVPRLLDDIRARVDGGEAMPAATAIRVRDALTSLLAALPAGVVKDSRARTRRARRA